MSIELSTIAEYLNRQDWPHRLDPDHDRIITHYQGRNIETLLIIIRLSEGGEFLHLFAPNLFRLKGHPCKGIAFQTLLNISWQVKLLRFEYDSADGEVRASVELPLEEAFLNDQQFNRCLHGLAVLLDQQTVPRIQTVLETGEDPGFQPWMDCFQPAAGREALWERLPLDCS